MPPPKKAPAKRIVPYSRLKQEQRRQRLVLGVGVAAILLVLSLLGFSYYYFRLAPAGEAVLRVNGSPFTAAELAAWSRLIAQGPLRGADPSALVNTAMEEAQRHETIRQKAPGLGVSVSPQEIEDTLRSSISPEENFASVYARRLKELEVSDGQYRKFVAAQLRYQKVVEHFASRLPQEVEQVHLYALTVAEEEKAKEIRGRLEGGEDFSALAREFSQDVGLKEKGGDMGWVPQGIYKELDEVAFSLAVGEVSQPVPLPGGFYLLKVTERQMRPLEAAHREQLTAGAFRDWFQEQQGASRMENLLDPRRLGWVLSQLRQAGSPGGRLPVK